MTDEKKLDKPESVVPEVPKPAAEAAKPAAAAPPKPRPKPKPKPPPEPPKAPEDQAPPEDMSLPVTCLLYTSPSPRDRTRSRMPSSA